MGALIQINMEVNFVKNLVTKKKKSFPFVTGFIPRYYQTIFAKNLLQIQVFSFLCNLLQVLFCLFYVDDVCFYIYCSDFFWLFSKVVTCCMKQKCQGLLNLFFRGQIVFFSIKLLIRSVMVVINLLRNIVWLLQFRLWGLGSLNFSFNSERFVVVSDQLNIFQVLKCDKQFIQIQYLLLVGFIINQCFQQQNYFQII
eukprot:TRINITY_DN12725_c0_g1_i4.p2 TRINITY_DN12725_c0_g1~~TRINITY_DN12725_c0_g1_i4.p2  ORF type:complete len:197 (+),score=-1.05 TRINITY_DN12725_c0_g1_i4:458-1048(+)